MFLIEYHVKNQKLLDSAAAAVLLEINLTILSTCFEQGLYAKVTFSLHY